MNMQSILNDVSIEQIVAPVAAGQTAVNNNSAPVFTGDCEAFAILTAVGTIVSTGTVDQKLKMGDASDGSDLQDVEGSAMTQLQSADTGKSLLVEVIRSRFKYVSVNIARGTANSDIRGVWIMKFGKRVTPVAQGANIKYSKALGSPALGTA